MSQTSHSQNYHRVHHLLLHLRVGLHCIGVVPLGDADGAASLLINVNQVAVAIKLDHHLPR